MKPLATRTLVAVLLLAALVYGGDWLLVRHGIWGQGNAFGTVTVTLVYIIHEKNDKTQYQYNSPQDQPCLHSLFPHFGYSPCWYLSRHQEQHVEI